MTNLLPIPEFFKPTRADKAWRVPYETRARQAAEWARQHALSPASSDAPKVWLLLVDMQNTFCLPDYELFVAGRNGRGAVEDTIRLCQFIYANLGNISHITVTMDTHTTMQIFHPIFLVDGAGAHPQPYSQISVEAVRSGQWKFNPELADDFGISPEYGQEMLFHYVAELERCGKYELTIWPYHAMLGGIGHALVSSIHEALFFHSIARRTQTAFETKGRRPFTENYSVIGPEVLTGPMGETLGERNPGFLEKLQETDVLVIAGQAKSHCVEWTVADLLEDIRSVDPLLAKKIYLLEDCTSPVVVPGADFTEKADEAFARFAAAGMHVVKSTDPMESWEGFPG